MLKIEVKKGNLERAIKAMRYKIKRTKLIKELRERKTFTKKSQKRRLQLEKAIAREQWKRENDD
jgi:small subunit ribosomal protein S21|tara:strand:- start:24 stop:215 length:192 start_codon:yes stop_codon:yes gene_type:complete